ncbi:MAG: mannose-1-phosphate guanylyltransferase [Candidatus Omnitrophica bacterium]|nr:mannose-1-phosphate guanylyltransferase [Candidatus Omnitrophota bacterium]
MNYAIILAGGIGSRFWPLSRELEPKQFLSVCLKRPMIEETICQIDKLIKKENIYIATNKNHSRKIKKCLRHLHIPKENFLFEPQTKNTLAPIALLSKRINTQDKNAVIAVLPCDHFIRYQKRFSNLLSEGIDMARFSFIVTLGIHPQRPETGYGYIKINPKPISPQSAGKTENLKIYGVQRYIEKPKLSRAKSFIKDKRYYWNSGIFIFRPDVMLGEIKKFRPGAYKIIMGIKNKKDLNKLWPGLPCVSIDYAIMEKTKKAVLLPADYGWVDMGSWQAIEEIVKKDKDGNIFRGNYIDIGSKNTTVWSDNRLVVTLGLEKAIVVDTKDAILVCSKNKSQEIKKVVQILKQKNFKKEI